MLPVLKFGWNYLKFAFVWGFCNPFAPLNFWFLKNLLIIYILIIVNIDNVLTDQPFAHIAVEIGIFHCKFADMNGSIRTNKFEVQWLLIHIVLQSIFRKCLCRIWIFRWLHFFVFRFKVVNHSLHIFLISLIFFYNQNKCENFQIMNTNFRIIKSCAKCK